MLAGDQTDSGFVPMPSPEVNTYTSSADASTAATEDMIATKTTRLRRCTRRRWVARESERGIVDIETLKHTNESLIKTFDEVMQIQEDGRRKRAEAEAEMRRMEGELKQKMLETTQR